MAMGARWFARAADVLGVEFRAISHAERVASVAGSFVGILLVFLTSSAVLDARDTVLVVASMGASAVLLFAVPHGPLSQPWPVLAGHLVSAIVGVVCAQLIEDPFLAGALSVSLAIGAMHYLRCIHPPGGATALTAVIGGESVQVLGFGYVLTPVLLNAAVIVVVAVLFNYPFAWRRYPVSLVLARETVRQADREQAGGPGHITHADLVYALSQLDTFIDVSEGDLLRIYELATGHADVPHLRPEQIGLGACYSNGRYGDEWAVRQIVDESGESDPDRDYVVFKVVAGAGRRNSGVARRAEFARWARHQVVRHESSWRRVPSAEG